MKFKKIAIITLISISLISIIYLFYKSKNDANIPTGQLVTPPDLPNFLDHGKEIQVNFPEEKYSFPNTLPIVRINPTASISESQALLRAESLGFSKNYNSFDDIKFGKMYIWNENGNSLIIYSKFSKIAYTPKKVSALNNSSLTQDKIIDIARQFLVSKNLVTDQDLGTAIFYGLDKETEDPKVVPFNSAVIYKVNFSPIIEGVEIIDLNPQESAINIWVDKSGSVIKVEVSPISISEISEEKYTIKNYNEFINSIDTSVVVSIEDGNILPQDLEAKDIIDLQVNSAKISYFRESYDTTHLQPIFVLSGTIGVVGKGPLKAILYLPAISAQP